MYNNRSDKEKAKLEVDMQTIQRAAEGRYDDIAKHNWPMIPVPSLFYLFAIYLVLSVLYNQTLSVMNAAGIPSIVRVATWWQTS